MELDKRAIFLLTSTDSGKKAFGTGFAVACKEGKLYLLTCAHVVEQLGGRVVASGADAVPHEAAIEAAGSSNTVDLALLSIRHDGDAPPLLNRPAKGKPDMPFQILGYGPHFGARENYVLRDIQGRLGKPISFKAVGSKSIEAWDIHVDDDEFSKLQGGYSGSPLCDAAGRLLAVVSHNADPAAGQRGHAVALANLKSIYPEIEQLIPSLSDLGNEPLDAAAMTSAPRVDQFSPNEVVISCALPTAFAHVSKAIGRLGKVKEEDRGQQFIEGRIKYGLQSVKVRASLVEREQGKTNVVIQASSDDVWGAGAKNATKRLVESLRNLDNQGYQPDRLGMHPAALVGLLIGFVFLLLLCMKYLFPLIFG